MDLHVRLMIHRTSSADLATNDSSLQAHGQYRRTTFPITIISIPALALHYAQSSDRGCNS